MCAGTEFTPAVRSDVDMEPNTCKVSCCKRESPFLAYFMDHTKVNWGRGGVRKGGGFCNLSFG